MATSIIEKKITDLIANENLNETSIYDFARDTNNPVGVYCRQIQNSPDNPAGTGNVGTLYISKPTLAGNYTTAISVNNGNVFVTNQLQPNQTSFIWQRVNTRKYYVQNDTSITSPTLNAWTTIPNLFLDLPVGTFLIIGEYNITGASQDAGIRVNNAGGKESFVYRGANSSWRHPIEFKRIITLSTATTINLQYYIQSTGTISYSELIAIEF